MALAFILILAGCYREPTGYVPPCGEQGVTRAELGEVGIFPPGGRFESVGGTLYATAYDFTHDNMFFDSNVAGLWMGRGEVQNVSGTGRPPPGTIVEINVIEEDFVEFDLPPGSYWVLSTNRATVAIVSCSEEGVRPVSSPTPE